MNANAKPQSDTRQAPGIKECWWEAPAPVKAVIGGIMVNRLSGFLQIYLVLYAVQRGFTETQAGIALGFLGVGAVIGTIGGGWLTARIGTRASIILSMAATAVCTVAILYTPTYLSLVVVATAVGTASQLYRPASAEVVSRFTAPDRRVLVFAMYRLATNIGTTAAPLIGTALVAHSYTALFWVEGAAALIVVIMGWLLVPEDLPKSEAGGSPHRETTSEGGTAARSTGYVALLRDRRFLLFLAGILGFSAVYNQYLSTLPLTIHDLGLSTAVYGVCVSLNGAIVIGCELLVTRWVQRWAARTAAVAGIVLVGLGMTAYALPLTVTSVILVTAVWSLGEILGSPTMTAYPAQAAPEELRSRYLGAAQGMFGLGAAAGPALGVALWSAVGSAFWLVCGAVALAAALVTYVAMPSRSVTP
ncbi:MFS transporter [Actinopolyspora mortivallis]|uniref:MFS transporter n=1 Tax=Actinopolyspora mortivallis TaxID=33906 RepID=A0A2T0GXJ6_ACTMO|nr:MFS transporter [Actinopolyspora mortivallis]PRW63817.1 MFS transporter [Actinopolyspora mortivallis]